MDHDAHHYCNKPMRCPSCIRRFWTWAQSHTRGRVPKATPEGPLVLRGGRAVHCMPIRKPTKLA